MLHGGRPYSFPLTFLALASVEYAQELKGDIPVGLIYSCLGNSLCPLSSWA
jgi:hypothetical protein